MERLECQHSLRSSRRSRILLLAMLSTSHACELGRLLIFVGGTGQQIPSSGFGPGSFRVGLWDCTSSHRARRSGKRGLIASAVEWLSLWWWLRLSSQRRGSGVHGALFVGAPVCRCGCFSTRGARPWVQKSRLNPPNITAGRRRVHQIIIGSIARRMARSSNQTPQPFTSMRFFY